MEEVKKRTLAITIGDIRGIGLEVLSKAVLKLNLHEKELPFLTLISPVEEITLTSIPDLKDITIKIVQKLNDCDNKKLNILITDTIRTEPTKTDKKLAGLIAIKSLKTAKKLAIKGEVEGIITLPIEKSAVSLHYKNFIGQTEFLAEDTGVEPEMIFYRDNLSLILVTRHIPLSNVSAQINRDRVLNAITSLINFMRMMAINDIRIAVLALNPHAGEGGLIGDEEEEILKAIEDIKGNKNYSDCLITGPHPPDALFAHLNKGDYNGIIAMYHDQGLIPMKMLGPSVNITWGLPFIRTSPDHGPAFDIAGKGMADERSTLMAIETAVGLLSKR